MPTHSTTLISVHVGGDGRRHAHARHGCRRRPTCVEPFARSRPYHGQCARPYTRITLRVPRTPSLPAWPGLAAQAAGGSGVERGSSAHTLPTDDELIAFAKATLGAI